MNALVFLVSAALSTNLPTLPADLQLFLEDEVNFSEKELQALEEGKVLTKSLDTGKESEVAIFGIMHLNVPLEYFIEKYRETVTYLKSGRVVEVGKFDNPPELSNMRELTLDSSDIIAIKECNVGNCNIKLSASIIDRFRQEVDWSKPECNEQVTGLVKQMLVSYVSAYLIEGNTAMGQYDDQKYPLRMADEFHELLQESSYLYDNAPELFNYLELFPQVESPNAEDFIIWSKKKYEKLRPILTLNHVTIFRKFEGQINTLIASKQIYASHYFEASLELTALVDNQRLSENSGFFLLYLNRSRLDTLRRSYPPGMKGKVKKGVLDKVEEEMKSTKASIETLYQKGNTQAKEK